MGPDLHQSTSPMPAAPHRATAGVPTIGVSFRRWPNNGFDGYLTMEIGFDRRAVEPDRIARDAYNYMKPLVDAAKAGRRK